MILVTGATGNVGRELVKQLSAAREPARALIRGSDRGGIPSNVEVETGDLNRPESLPAALKGIRSVFLLGGYPDMQGLLAQMRRARVEHVVLLSSRSVIGGRESNAIVKMWLISEDAVRSSGISWTILQPSSFMTNALRWLPQLRLGNLVKLQFATVPIAAIDPYDIAAVASSVFTNDSHAGRSYALSGPQALLPGEQVRILGETLKRSLTFESQSDTAAKAELERLFSRDFAEAMFRFYAEGEFDDSIVLPTVLELTGRHPRNFNQWCSAHADKFREAIL